MDPKVWGKLLTLHRRGYGVDEEALLIDAPSGGALEQAPRWDLVDTESCGGGIRFLAVVLIVWGYVGIYRRKEYVGGATWGPRGWRAHLGGGVGAPPTSCPPGWCLDVGSKSSGSRSFQKSCSRRFHSVWTPFDIPFLRNTEIGKKTAICTRPLVSRLVPKII